MAGNEPEARLATVFGSFPGILHRGWHHCTQTVAIGFSFGLPTGERKDRKRWQLSAGHRAELISSNCTGIYARGALQLRDFRVSCQPKHKCAEMFDIAEKFSYIL
jgi:hypothetical protein